MFACYLAWYGLGRAWIEGLRTDSLYIAGTPFRVSQVLSAGLALICLVALIVLTVKYTKNPKPIDGVDYFLEEELKKEKVVPWLSDKIEYSINACKDINLLDKIKKLYDNMFITTVTTFLLVGIIEGILYTIISYYNVLTLKIIIELIFSS